MADPRGSLSENIAFLAQFANCGRALADPVVNLQPLITTVERSKKPVRRLLTFNQERRLAEAFALVLATTEKPSQVGAVCIEEKPSGVGFIVRIAENSGSLENKQQAFHRIVNTAKLESKSNENRVLLTEIVTTNQFRILGRLRSKHASRSRKIESGRRAIIEQLHSAIIKIPKSKYHSFEDYEKIRDSVASWLHLYRKLESLSESEARSDQGAHILVNLVLELSKGLDIEKFANILSLLGPKDSPWPNSRYGRVLRTYTKVSQYKKAADYIGHMVRMHSYWELGNVSGAPFELHAVGAQPDENEGLGFLRRSLNVGSEKKRKEIQSAIVEKLGKGLPKIEASVEKAVAVHKKVHAEIQLLYHYAQHPEVLFKPRIFCSSKEACYLCHLFIAVHGQFHSPRSHGNFYPEWRLPRMDEVKLPKTSMAHLKQVINEFNRAVEDRIRYHLENSRTVRPKPSESTIFSVGSFIQSALPGTLASKSAKAKIITQSSHLQISKDIVANIMEPQTAHNLLATNNVELEHTTSAIDTEAKWTAEEEKDNESRISQQLEHIKQDLSHSTIALGVVKQDLIARISQSSSDNVSQIRALESTVLSLNNDAIGGLHSLSRGQKIKIIIRQGDSVQFKIPGIHIRFSHENSLSELVPCDRISTVLYIEWLSSEISSNGAERIDIRAPALKYDVPCRGVSEKSGIILHGKGQEVFMRVDSQM